MRIAILSLILHTNYGGILQAYALQRTLERVGHEVQILSTNKRFPTLPLLMQPFCYAKRIAKKILTNDPMPIRLEHTIRKEYPIISQHTQRFIEEHLHVRMIRSFSEVTEDDYDAFVVGSDQVWRPLYFEGQWRSSIADAFLQFAQGWNVKRIAYAPSFGVDVWEYDEQQTHQCGELLRMFDQVSVREESGKQLCQQLGVEAQHLLDPTMLLTADDYQALSQGEPASTGNLLVYMLDENEEKKVLVEKIARDKGLQPFHVKGSTRKTDPLSQRIQPKVETWLKGFDDAQMIVTDSFHACVFSLIFHKPFVVIGNAERGLSRVKSLLKMFGQESRLIQHPEEYSNSNNNLSWEEVDNIWNRLRSESERFLMEI